MTRQENMLCAPEYAETTDDSAQKLASIPADLGTHEESRSGPLIERLGFTQLESGLGERPPD
ncbi:MAG: hypothetical protein M3458_20775 [Acidobacteriota bacterium]|nr:hypothetical protein [Acidobacteriota bacterium]